MFPGMPLQQINQIVNPPGRDPIKKHRSHNKSDKKLFKKIKHKRHIIKESRRRNRI